MTKLEEYLEALKEEELLRALGVDGEELAEAELRTSILLSELDEEDFKKVIE